MKTQPREPLFTNLYRGKKDTRITNCYGELCADSPAKRFSHTQACINMPSVKAERSQSPECALLKEQPMQKPHKQHADPGKKSQQTQQHM